MKKTTRFITETGIMIAILIVMQFLAKSFGQFITGSVVNLILVISVVILGIPSGIIVAGISPFIAFTLSIGTPFLVIVPFIALGNLVYVLIVGKLFDKNKFLAIIIGAISKFLTLYIFITKIALAFINVPAEKLNVLRISFSYPQLITASIGGMIALLVIPYIRKGLKWGK